MATDSSSIDTDTGSADLSSLLQALEMNNLLSAQNSLFSQLQQDVQSTGSTETTNNSASSIANDDSNPMKRDMDALGKALSSGDLSSAQNVFATIMQHMQHQSPPDTNTSGSNVTSVASTASSSSSSDALSNNLGTLGKALSSGDLTSAKNSFSELLESMQAISAPDSTSDTDAASSYSGFNQKQLFDMLKNLLSGNTQAGTIKTSA
jgi:hypothetical protein